MLPPDMYRWDTIKQIVKPPLLDPNVPDAELGAWIDKHTMRVHQFLDRLQRIERKGGGGFVLNDAYGASLGLCAFSWEGEEGERGRGVSVQDEGKGKETRGCMDASSGVDSRIIPPPPCSHAAPSQQPGNLREVSERSV